MKRVWSSLPKGNDSIDVINGYKRFGFPNFGGEIDGRHISIFALSEHHVDYMHRKGWFSVIMQGEPFHQCVHLHRMAWARAPRQGFGKL